MTIRDGWLSKAKRVDGIADKVYTQLNSGEGIVGHSIEGEDRHDDIPDRFLSTEKDSEGRYTAHAAASCMFINPYEGPLIQMYPIWASTWTSGNSAANTKLWAVESEGFAREPLNENQVRNMLYLAEEWEAHTKKKLSRGDDGHAKTMWEHREVWDWAAKNGGPTACPSGRYAPFYIALKARGEEMGMTPDERIEFEQMKDDTRKLRVRVYQLEQQVWDEPNTPRDQEHPYARMTDGNTATLGRLVEAIGGLQPGQAIDNGVYRIERHIG